MSTIETFSLTREQFEFARTGLRARKDSYDAQLVRIESYVYRSKRLGEVTITLSCYRWHDSDYRVSACWDPSGGEELLPELGSWRSGVLDAEEARRVYEAWTDKEVPA